MKKTKPQCKTCDNHAGGGLDYCYQCLGAILDNGRGKWQPQRINDSNRPSVEAYKPKKGKQTSSASPLVCEEHTQLDKRDQLPLHNLSTHTEAVHQLIGYTKTLWHATAYVWHYEQDQHKESIPPESLPTLTALGQFLADEMDMRLRAICEQAQQYEQLSTQRSPERERG